MNISKRRLTSIGRFLTFLLRHAPESANLTLDGQGWVSVEQLVANTQKNPRPITVDELLDVVANDDKERFSLRSTMTGLEIRCSQGHSSELGVDLGYKAEEPPTILYHGYPDKIETLLMSDGLKGMLRQHVHLTDCETTATMSGKRYGKPKIMVVDAIAAERSGVQFYRADNGVWLAEHIPPEFLTPRVAI